MIIINIEISSFPSFPFISLHAIVIDSTLILFERLYCSDACFVPFSDFIIIFSRSSLSDKLKHGMSLNL